MVLVMFYWESWGSAIHVDVTLTGSTYLKMYTCQIQPFMETTVYSVMVEDPLGRKMLTVMQ